MLQEKVYPAITSLFPRLIAEYPDFPILTESTLLKTMKEIDFQYRRTTKGTVAFE